MDVGGVSGSASYIGGVLARRQRAGQRLYDRLASVVEDRQLENCGCHLATMEAIAGEYRNPVYAAQQVSRYDATAAYDARMIRQGEQARAAAAARARESSGGCGVLGLSCAAHFVSHAADDIGSAASDVGNWVNNNSRWLGVAELALGAVGMIATGPLGIGIFALNMILSVATTADSCAHSEAVDCATGIASMALGGAGFMVGSSADEDFEAAEAASKGNIISRTISAPLLKARGLLGKAVSQVANGHSLITGGLSIEPCHAGHGPGC